MRPPEARVQAWFTPPLQLQISTAEPLVSELLYASRHLPAPTAWTGAAAGRVVVPPETRYITVPCAGTGALMVPAVVVLAPLHRSVRP